MSLSKSMVQTSDRFAFWIAIGRIFSMLATFVMPLVLTRSLSVADYGIFSQFFTLYTVLYAMFALGIHTNLFFFYPNSSKQKQNECVGNTLLLLCFSGIILGGSMFLPPIRDAVFGDSALSKYASLVIICIALAVPMNIVAPLFSVKEDKISAILFPALVAVGRILTVVVIAIYFHDIQWIMIGMVIFQLIVTLLSILYSLHAHKFVINLSFIKTQLSYSLPFGMAVALQLLSNYFDKLVSVTLLSPSDYAIYSVAFLSIPGVTQLYDSLAQVNIINMSKCYNNGEYEKIGFLYKAFVQKTLSFSAPLIFAVALYAEEIISFLFTKEYSSAATYFRIYSLTFLVTMFGAGTILRSVNKTKLSLCAFLCSCAIGLPLTYYLIKSFGIHGAILSAVVNIILPRFIQLGLEIKVTKQNLLTYLPWKNIFKILLISIGLLAPLMLMKWLFHTTLVINIILAFIYTLLTYTCFIKQDVFIINSYTVQSCINKLASIVKR